MVNGLVSTSNRPYDRGCSWFDAQFLNAISVPPAAAIDEIKIKIKERREKKKTK